MDQNVRPPLITVLMPVYNGGQYLRLAVDSVLSQTFRNFEFLIINDGSKDNSEAIIKSYGDSRIRLISHQNQGLIHCLNEGVQEARGEYIARIDSDDIWNDSHKLEEQVAFLTAHQECTLIGTFARAIDETGKQLFSLTYPTSDKEIRDTLLRKNCFVHSSVIFKKETHLKAGGFDSNHKYVEDFDLWCRMGTYGSFANIPRAMVAYRINTQGISQKNALAQAKASLRTATEHRHSYPHYWQAWLKWSAKIAILHIASISLFTKIKMNYSSR